MKRIDELHKKAVQALNRGQLKDLERYAQGMLQLDVQHADAWFLLSFALSSSGRIRDALKAVDRAIQLAPEFEDYRAQKARYHSVIKEEAATREAVQLALHAGAKKALSLDTLGVALTSVGDYEEAVALLERAVLAEETHPQFRFNLATALQFLGRDDEAKFQYREAIRLKPDFARAYWSLSELDKERVDPALLVDLEAQLARPGLNEADQLYFAHACSRVYEKNKEYEKAFGVLASAKQRWRQRLRYDFQNDAVLFDALEQHFSGEAPLAVPDASAGEGMIFVVGMPRTGTTLLDRIISTHTQVRSLGELPHFAIAVRKAVASHSPRTLDIEVIEKAMGSDMAVVAKGYLDNLREQSSNSHRLIDKMPLNFLQVGFIRKALPAAKIVCLQRHPLDTCLSNFRQLFALNSSYYHYNFMLEDIVRFYIRFQKLMAFWERTFPGTIYTLDYEALTAGPERTLKPLFAYLDLPWEAEVLNFHAQSSAVATPSAAQVREKLYTRAVGRWKLYDAHLAEAKNLLDAANIPY